ncbi:hypothetical protein OF83DRAFT_1135516 [Amylostereum chailletii]|nr:hypothetical protein OF83DRAFT_1135516 [Amylostereum chailletii]
MRVKKAEPRGIDRGRKIRAGRERLENTRTARRAGGRSFPPEIWKREIVGGGGCHEGSGRAGDEIVRVGSVDRGFMDEAEEPPGGYSCLRPACEETPSAFRSSALRISSVQSSVSASASQMAPGVLPAKLSKARGTWLLAARPRRIGIGMRGQPGEFSEGRREDEQRAGRERWQMRVTMARAGGAGLRGGARALLRSWERSDGNRRAVEAI